MRTHGNFKPGSYSAFSVVVSELDTPGDRCFEFRDYPEAARCYAKAIRSRLFEVVTLAGFRQGDVYGDILRKWPPARILGPWHRRGMA